MWRCIILHLHETVVSIKPSLDKTYKSITNDINIRLTIDTTVVEYNIADFFTGHTVPQANTASSLLHTRSKIEWFFTFGSGSSNQSNIFSIEQLEMSFISPYYSFLVIREPSDIIICKPEAKFSL